MKKNRKIDVSGFMLKIVILVVGLLVCYQAVRPQSPVFSPADTISIKERLPDGSFVVEINSVEFRALPPDKIREILQMKNDLKLKGEELAEVKNAFTQFKSTAQLAQEQAVKVVTLEKEVVVKEKNFFQSEYGKELALRTKYEKNLKRCTGKIVFFRLCIF